MKQTQKQWSKLVNNLRLFTDDPKQHCVMQKETTLKQMDAMTIQVQDQKWPTVYSQVARLFQPWQLRIQGDKEICSYDQPISANACAK